MLSTVHAQTESDSLDHIKVELDRVYISETEEVKGPEKVLHAEPLFIDLIRDLGARKGEQEWNIGLGMTDRNTYDEYTTLVEYEWAPVNRLGLEIELPFNLYFPVGRAENRTGDIPRSKLNSLKAASQYTFYVSEKHSTSFAIGYIHEFELKDFTLYQKGNVYSGNVYNPFVVGAKRWGNQFHTLLYTGPVIAQHFNQPNHVSYQINSNFHYLISGTRNFIGIEFNKELTKQDFDMTIRPQMRLCISDQMMIGIVTGIPLSRETERLSSFIRLIYEPKHH